MAQLNLSMLTADEKALRDVMVGLGDTLFEPAIGPEGVTYQDLSGSRARLGQDTQTAELADR